MAGTKHNFYTNRSHFVIISPPQLYLRSEKYTWTMNNSSTVRNYTFSNHIFNQCSSKRCRLRSNHKIEVQIHLMTCIFIPIIHNMY